MVLYDEVNASKTDAQGRDRQGHRRGCVVGRLGKVAVQWEWQWDLPKFVAVEIASGSGNCRKWCGDRDLLLLTECFTTGTSFSPH